MPLPFWVCSNSRFVLRIGEAMPAMSPKKDPEGHHGRKRSASPGNSSIKSGKRQRQAPQHKKLPTSSKSIPVPKGNHSRSASKESEAAQESKEPAAATPSPRKTSRARVPRKEYSVLKAQDQEMAPVDGGEYGLDDMSGSMLVEFPEDGLEGEDWGGDLDGIDGAPMEEDGEEEFPGAAAPGAPDDPAFGGGHAEDFFEGEEEEVEDEDANVEWKCYLKGAQLGLVGFNGFRIRV